MGEKEAATSSLGFIALLEDWSRRGAQDGLAQSFSLFLFFSSYAFYFPFLQSLHSTLPFPGLFNVIRLASVLPCEVRQ